MNRDKPLNGIVRAMRLQLHIPVTFERHRTLEAMALVVASSFVQRTSPSFSDALVEFAIPMAFSWFVWLFWRSASLLRSLAVLVGMIVAAEALRLVLFGVFHGWQSLHDEMSIHGLIYSFGVAVLFPLAYFPLFHLAKRL